MGFHLGILLFMGFHLGVLLFMQEDYVREPHLLS